MAALRPILPKLTKLSINGRLLTNQCNDIDWQLKKLYIYGDFDYDTFMPNIKIPKLMQLGLFGCIEMIEMWFHHFLADHRHIQDLILCNCVVTLSKLRMFSEYLPNLNGLTIVDGSIYGDDSTSTYVL